MFLWPRFYNKKYCGPHCRGLSAMKNSVMQLKRKMLFSARASIFVHV